MARLANMVYCFKICQKLYTYVLNAIEKCTDVYKNRFYILLFRLDPHKIRFFFKYISYNIYDIPYNNYMIHYIYYL